MQRYFAKNENLELEKNDIHHIINVMRMKIGDNIHIVWDRKIYLCEIINIDKKNVVYKKVEEIYEENELDKKVTVAFTLVNESKTDFILQKCTELGAYSFIPIITERTKIKIDNKESKKIERWNKITKEAAEQSHRSLVPKVSSVCTLSELLQKQFDLKLLCSTKEMKKSIKNMLQNSTKYDNIIIVVGPEGGITDGEEKFLNENGYDSISLGTTILRTETAPIFAVCAIRYELMR